uniref:Protoheme IX farnesyltransferase, mitochondrial n=1 Tax=Lynceus sp. MCZ IZ 141354 TaxID=1930659 RepID=A0A9N6WZ37_9CRUS|nr:EOG090X09NT [Lynceus sp. MCZ IZ 141354]
MLKATCLGNGRLLQQGIYIAKGSHSLTLRLPWRPTVPIRLVTNAQCKVPSITTNVALTEKDLHDSKLPSINLISDKELAPCIIEESNNVKADSSPLDKKQLLNYYAMLAKYRLTGLVVWSAVTGYVMAPEVTNLSVLITCLAGTALTSAAANTINQYFEVPFDSQMLRTSNRVLVRGLISPLHAVGFAAASACTGLSMLYFGVNGICASLGALTLVLYTMVYTPMKRLSIANTWLGSVVGALPPLMGYAGCAGYLDPASLVLGGVLFAWQFPHFNALSWNLRGDYSKAGYRMMSVTNPSLCRKTTLRYSYALLGLCSVAAPLTDLTTWTFALDSLPLNLYLIHLSHQFYQNTDSASSRKLFRYSLLSLPSLMLLMLLHKKKREVAKSDNPYSDDVLANWVSTRLN